MKKLVVILNLLLALSALAQQKYLSLSEVMFYPSSGNNEFIELFNLSDQSINLSGYKIKYYSAAADSLVDAGEGFVLQPLQYAIILEGDYDLTNSFYLIPKAALVLKIDDNSFGATGMSNSTSRGVVLLNAANDTIDSYWYSADNNISLSDEKIELNSGNLNNWKNSLVKNGTPGYKNSVSLKDFDLCVTSIKALPPEIKPEADVDLVITVKNKGKIIAGSYEVRLFCDVNSDSVLSESELLFSEVYQNLMPGDSSVITINTGKWAAGNYNLCARVDITNDEDLSNNTFSYLLQVQLSPALFNDVVINEIMYAPVNPEPEWIELYNHSSKDINIKGWKLSDYSSNSIIAKADHFIRSGGYAVITKDSSLKNMYPDIQDMIIMSLPSLNNTGDMVRIADEYDHCIDSLEYLPSWGGGSGGRSLERISAEESSSNQANWGSCKIDPSPGKQNSLSPKDFDLSITSMLLNSSYVIDGDALLLKIDVKNEGSMHSGPFQLKLSGRSIDDDRFRTLTTFSSDGISAGELIQFSFSNTGYNTGVNYLLSVINFDNDHDLSNNFYDTSFTVIKINEVRGDLVINEIMYTPLSPEPEWIEIFNVSDKVINLKSYKLADRNDTVKIVSGSILLQPKEYFIAAKDSSIISYYEIESPFCVAKFPSLNNSGDRIILLDSLNRTIDSLEYASSWGGLNGKSLERKDALQSSCEQSNWTQCRVNPTPGRFNSVTRLDVNAAITEFSNKRYFIEGEIPQFKITIFNTGLKSVTDAEVHIYNDSEGDSVVSETEVPLKVLQTGIISPGDSLVLYFQLSELQHGNNYLIARLNLHGDQDLSDNIAFTSIKGVDISLSHHDLIINEIMYAPGSPEPEWIEIFNRSKLLVPFTGFYIKDRSSRVQIKCKPVELAPGEFVVVTRDTSFYNFHDIDPAVVISNFPVLNNTGDIIILQDSLFRTIDSVEYFSAWGGSGAKSLERVNLENFNSDSSNWKECTAAAGSTPGELNSVSLKKYDIGIAGINYLPENPLINEAVSMSIKVLNYGSKNSQYDLLVYEDANLDSIPDLLIREFNTLALDPGDSTIITINLIVSIQKEYAFIAVIKSEWDENPSNNFCCRNLCPVSVSVPILVNEIMYSPEDGEPEWIELYNNSSENVNLKSWTVTDIYTTPVTSVISENDYWLPAHSYLILSRDTSLLYFYENIRHALQVMKLPVLNNDKDGIVVKDISGNVSDSVVYLSSWGGGDGYSLERKSFSPDNGETNWGSCVSGRKGTPGEVNSIAQKQYDLSINGISYVPEFPVSGDKLGFAVQIKNVGLAAADQYSVRFFSRSDWNSERKYYDEVSGGILNPGDSIVITGISEILIDSVIIAGAEIVFQGDMDFSNDTISCFIKAGYKQNCVVVNEIMFNPSDNFSEWFELYNASEEDVNLKDWKFKSSSTVIKTLTDIDFILKPAEYLIVSNKNPVMNLPEGLPVLLSSFTLSNTSGSIILKDFRNALIDSVIYNSKWGNIKAVSLERISVFQPAVDSLSWHASLCEKGNTPGEINSVINLLSYQRGDLVINEIMYDPAETNCEFIELYNAGKGDIDLGGWTFTDLSGNVFPVCRHHLMLSPEQYFIVSSDSMIFKNYPGTVNSSFVLCRPDLSLNQSGDIILLRDALGSVIDSVLYLPDFHNRHIATTKNRSLERINPELSSVYPDNWSTSVNTYGATPGFINSVNVKNEIKEKSLSISPNPFSPDSDGFEDFTMINYQFDQPVSVIRIKIFDSQGRLLRSIYDNLISGSSGSVIFDGLDDNGRALNIGIYIVFIEGITPSNNCLSNKSVVVVARKI